MLASSTFAIFHEAMIQHSVLAGTTRSEDVTSDRKPESRDNASSFIAPHGDYSGAYG